MKLESCFWKLHRLHIYHVQVMVLQPSCRLALRCQGDAKLMRKARWNEYFQVLPNIEFHAREEQHIVDILLANICRADGEHGLHECLTKDMCLIGCTMRSMHSSFGVSSGGTGSLGCEALESLPQHSSFLSLTSNKNAPSKRCQELLVAMPLFPVASCY